MAKKTPSYVLTLSLKTEKFQEDILNTNFESCRNIYNAILGKALKSYNCLIRTNKYKSLKDRIIKTPKEKRKPLYKELTNLYNEFGLNEYSLHKLVTPMYNHYKIQAHIGQKIATRVWNAIEDLLWGDGEKVRFKQYGELNSIEGKSNAQTITYREGSVNVFKLKIPIIIRNNDDYANMALQSKIKFCRILRKEIKGKTKFYVQLILEGIPPMKINKQTGEIKGKIGEGKLGIDIGIQTIAISSKYDVKLLELAPNVVKIDKKIKRIQRYMDRSRRSTNPNKYNENGTVKKGNKDKWIYSNKYIKAKNIRKELYRKQSEIRKQDHYNMINSLLVLGNEFYVENMNYKALQKRSKNTTINERTGRFNKKKRFGKSLANKSPAMFLVMLDNKLKWNGTELIKVNTRELKASQFNPLNGEYNKKKLSQRWNIMKYGDEEIRIQRDLLSAFNIMCVNKDLKSYDIDYINQEFDTFKVLHDKEIERLRETNNISSMGL